MYVPQWSYSQGIELRFLTLRSGRDISVYPSKTRRKTIVGSILGQQTLGQHRRRWASIHPTLGERPAFAGIGQVTLSQQTQNICIAFVQRRHNVFDVGPALHKCYTMQMSCLLGVCNRIFQPDIFKVNLMYNERNTYIFTFAYFNIDMMKYERQILIEDIGIRIVLN